MNKEFVPYEQALELKELGFDELCFTFYWYDGVRCKSINDPFNHNKRDSISAPLYQQAFRWFREKYGLIGWVEGKFKYKYCIESNIPADEQLNRFPFRKYEEAELECIKKLIEIIKIKTI